MKLRSSIMHDNVQISHIEVVVSPPIYACNVFFQFTYYEKSFHRQKALFSSIYEMGAMKESLVDSLDHSNNTKDLLFSPNLQREDQSLGITDDRKFSLDEIVPLSQACIKRDWITAEALIKHRPSITREGVNQSTLVSKPLYTLLLLGSTPSLSENLLRRCTKKDLTLWDSNVRTAFGIAAESGNIKIAEILFEKNKELPVI
ncbi:unnamed protein product [Microthlaspi erraticum]|uniref:PGG domain-containing protein n=1 Tax=Microthlaspi erraticum TaxID=1685480 RepID=A0A6D2HYU7_9BRAS|nr:unnamed protein product [Microthlaspi erraticum]